MYQDEFSVPPGVPIDLKVSLRILRMYGNVYLN